MHSVASTTFYVDLMPDYPIDGCFFDDPMSPHISQNTANVPFNMEIKYQRMYGDQLCFFGCLAAHQTKMRRVDDGVEGCARALYYQWTCKSIDDFKGVTSLSSMNSKTSLR